MNKTNRLHKKTFNERLNKWEKLVRDFPNWPLVIVTVAVVGITSFWADENANLSKIPPSIKEIQKKTYLLGKIIVRNAETIAIVAAVILYYKEAPARKDQRQYEAWQIIDKAAASGVKTSYARYKALKELNDNDMSLEGLDIPCADLRKIELTNADLNKADLNKADLEDANLRGAILKDTNLEGANLKGANLKDADLEDANLRGAILEGANLQGAILEGAILYKAILKNANLKDAKLGSAILESTYLEGANLKGANLKDAKLGSAILNKADLQDANLEGAHFRGADLTSTNLSGANLQDISWNERTTKWKEIKGWETARNIPEKLKQQLSL